MAGRGSRSVRTAPGLRGYLAATRSPLVGVAVTLPLLLLHNVGILVPGNDRMNAADLLTRFVPEVWGIRALLLANGALVMLSLVLLVVVFRRGAFRWSWWLLLCAEGVLYGLLMTLGVRWLLGQAHLLAAGADVAAGAAAEGATAAAEGAARTPLFQALVLSAGAGWWEEAVFRLGLVGVPLWVASRLAAPSGARRWVVLIVTGVLATAASAAAFSALHYVGAAEEPSAYSFWYRTLAGVFFTGLFLGRGFAVASWTHFLYDVLVMTL